MNSRINSQIVGPVLRQNHEKSKRSSYLGTDQRSRAKWKEKKDLPRNARVQTVWAENYEKGREAMMQIIQMIGSWKLNLYLTFKIMFMLIFKNGCV